MNDHPNAAILGTGSYLPERILTNADLERMVETSDDWIVSRTGIRERHIASEHQATSDLAYEAAKRALENAQVAPTELDLILVATVTPDTPTPATSCYLQQKLGAPQAAAMDVSAACSGFVYGLGTARAFILSGMFRRVLLVGAEKLSSYVDWKDRSTCVLFGDGAGAVVVGPVGDEGRGLLHPPFLAADGTETQLLQIPGGGSRIPPTAASLSEGTHFLKMEGREVFKIAVKVMVEAVKEALQRANLTLDQVSLVIPHQANLRIIEAIRDRLGLPLEKMFVNVDRMGNTSAASIAIALDEAARTGRLKKGDPLVLVAFGAGLTTASQVIIW